MSRTVLACSAFSDRPLAHMSWKPHGIRHGKCAMESSQGVQCLCDYAAQRASFAAGDMQLRHAECAPQMHTPSVLAGMGAAPC